MGKSVIIENEMPSFIQCKGINYEETRNLNLKDVVMFIERDLHSFLRKLTQLDPTLAISVVKAGDDFEIRIHITVAFANARQPLRRRIESLLWRYNCQTFVQKRGELVPVPPRFRYNIEVTQHGNEISCQDTEASNVEGAIYA